MIKDIGVEKALSLERAKFIDLRSPLEYHKAHIPGAVNIPLLLDDEHSEIGTIYRLQGSRSAKIKGLEVVAPRLLSLVSEIRKNIQEDDLVLYCWRGGDRSSSVARLLDIMQIDGYKLAGGYKAYRTHVIKRLEELPRSQVVILHGLTGTGKTEIIKKMADDGWPAMDLEGLANHRGSVFGGLGLGEQPEQKQFDSMLLETMQKFSGHDYLIMENESKKIGRLFLPDRLFTKMQQGFHVLIYDTLENRISRLFQEYVEDIRNNTKDFLPCLEGLKPYLGNNKTKEATNLINLGKIREAIRILLIDHYDILYGQSCLSNVHFDLTVNGSDSNLAASSITSWLINLVKGERQAGNSG